MFRRSKSSVGYAVGIAAAAAAAGAMGYMMLSGSKNMRSVKKKATKAIGRISDRMIDNINALM